MAADEELGTGAPPLALDDLSILADVRASLFGGGAPLTVGRYEVGSRIGGGGGGMVFRGTDPRLGRAVAIKFVRPIASDSPDAVRRRVLDEARAAARLSHPNVVEVYDVGEYCLPGSLGDATEIPREGVFFAMELLPGPDLAQWLRDGPRAANEILDAFVEAGRGLEAAHAAGLVHRDFKPTNVAFGSDGRIAVLDFGVAAVADARSRTTGGTPWYMAPEQLERGPVDARADQFAFCLALQQALDGTGPDHHPASVEGLQAAKREGRLRVAHPHVSRRIRRAIERGLSPQPADRFASMSELLAVLERRPTWRARVPLGVAAGALFAWGAAMSLPVRGAGTWPEAAAASFDPDPELLRAESLLEAGDVERAQALCDEMLDADRPEDRARALLCHGRVQRHRGEFADALATYERAFWLASEHGSMDVAARAAAQTAAVAVNLANNERALEWVRHGEAAMARASGEVAWVEADLAIARASVAMTEGRPGDALPHYERALAVRTRVAGAESRGAATALKLVANCLQRLDRPAEALPRHDEAVRRLVAVLGERHVDVATALNDRATSYQSLQRIDEALADLRRALAIIERRDEPAHPKEGMIRSNLGYSLRQKGRHDEAIEQYRRSMEIRLASHGELHTTTLKTANNLGLALLDAGRVEEAETLLRDALERYEALPAHPSQRFVLVNLARAARARGDEDAAAQLDAKRERLLAQLDQGEP